MSKRVAKPTRKQPSRGPLPTDQWPVYPTREERALEPTGKWGVPKYEGLTRDAVEQFFRGCCNPGDDVRFTVNVQDIDNRFLVYMEGVYCYPRPSTRFLDGTLISQWHMSTSVYWNMMFVYDARFRAVASHNPGDPPPTLCIHNGIRQYPGDGDARFNGLPYTAKCEAFHMKIQRMHASVARAVLRREHYHAYIRSLAIGHNQMGMPLISRTTQLDEDRVQVTLKYDGPDWVLSCASVSLCVETGPVTIAFYSD